MPFGFQYNFYNTRKNEFKLAKFLFDRYPELVKISRKTWEHIKELPSDSLDLLIAHGFAPHHPPKHSYFKTSDGQVLAFSRGKNGGLLGKGSCCQQVKCATNEHGRIYAIKTGAGRPDDRESEITRNLGLTKGRGTTGYLFKPESWWDGERFYRVQEYLGQSLGSNKNLTRDLKVHVARKTFWELHKLNTGLAATDGTKYAHNDIKPDNIVLDIQNRPKFIDFGLSSIIDEEDNRAEYRGAKTYWPLSSNERNLDKAYPRLDKMRKEEKDLFALKRSFYIGDLTMQLLDTPNGFSETEYESLPRELQSALCTANADEALQRKDTALSITLHFIGLEFKRESTLLLTYSKKQQIGLCRVIELTDEINLFADRLEFFERYKLSNWINEQREKLFSATEEETNHMLFIFQTYYDYLTQVNAAEPEDLKDKEMLSLFKTMKLEALKGPYTLTESIRERLANLLDLFCAIFSSFFKMEKENKEQPADENNLLIHSFFQSGKNRGEQKPTEPQKVEPKASENPENPPIIPGLTKNTPGTSS